MFFFGKAFGGVFFCVANLAMRLGKIRGGCALFLSRGEQILLGRNRNEEKV